MCGIAGLIKLGKTTIAPQKTVLGLLSSIQDRGRDAVGVAWETEGSKETYYNKQAGLVKDFNPVIPDSAFVVLGHVRAATHGSPDNNENNHPIFGERYLITHNGVVRPKKLLPYPYKGETDTEIMLSYVERDGWDGVPESPGSKSVAVWDMKSKELMLYTSAANLSVVYYKDCLIWCSVDTPLVKLIEEEGNPFVTILNVQKDTGYIIKPFQPKVEIVSYTVKSKESSDVVYTGYNRGLDASENYLM